MKTYTIAELLLAFTSKSYIGYCYRGQLEGHVIVCDVNDSLSWINKDGEMGYDFYFGIVDVDDIEEVRNYVFFHELEDDKMKSKICSIFIDCFIKSLTSDENEQESEE